MTTGIAIAMALNRSAASEAAVLFDKWGMIRKLEETGGFTRSQAATLADSFHEALMDSTATKHDLALQDARLDKVEAHLIGTFWKGNLALVIWFTGLLVALRFLH